MLENWLQAWQSGWSSCWDTGLGLRWILLCVWEENMSVHQLLLRKREAMRPILNLACLFKMQIPENKESDYKGHWKLGAQLWAKLLCTQPHCSIYQSRQQHLLLFAHCCCPTPYILFEEAGEQTLSSCSEASPISPLDLFLQKTCKPDGHYLGVTGLTEFCIKKAVSLF